MKTQPTTVVSVNNSSTTTPKAKKVSKVEFINTTVYSKGLAQKLDKIDFYQNKKDASNWEKLLMTSNIMQVENLSLSKAFKQFLKIANANLPKSVVKDITFANLVQHLNIYKKGAFIKFEYFTPHQIKLIFNDLLKKNNKSIKLALKVAKQGGTITQK